MHCSLLLFAFVLLIQLTDSKPVRNNRPPIVPKRKGEMLVRVSLACDEADPYAVIYIAKRSETTCIVDASFPCNSTNPDDPESLRRAYDIVRDLKKTKGLKNAVRLTPSEARDKYGRAFPVCSIDSAAEVITGKVKVGKRKVVRAGLLKAADSVYISSLSSVGSAEDDNQPSELPDLPGCELETNADKGLGCYRYTQENNVVIRQCVYNKCSKKAMGSEKKPKGKKEKAADKKGKKETAAAKIGPIRPTIKPIRPTIKPIWPTFKPVPTRKLFIQADVPVKNKGKGKKSCDNAKNRGKCLKRQQRQKEQKSN